MGNTISNAMGVSEMFFPAVPPSYDARHERLVWFRAEAGSSVPGMLVLPRWVTNPGRPIPEGGRRKLADEVKICAIYFHPNACDIGDSIRELEVIRDGAFAGDAAVLAPEYPGYGLLSDFNPSPKGIDRIAAAAFNFCVHFHGFRADQIVLWGRSIGTGPASSLARSLAVGSNEDVCRGSSKSRIPCSFGLLQSEGEEGKPLAAAEDMLAKNLPAMPCAALILMMPFCSIADVVKTHAGSVAAAFVDQMWNVADATADQAVSEMPLCIMHPENDEIVPKSHGEQVYAGSASKRKLGVWITGEGHNLRSTVYHMKPVYEFLVANIAALREQAEPESCAGDPSGLRDPALDPTPPVPTGPVASKTASRAQEPISL